MTTDPAFLWPLAPAFPFDWQPLDDLARDFLLALLPDELGAMCAQSRNRRRDDGEPWVLAARRAPLGCLPATALIQFGLASPRGDRMLLVNGLRREARAALSGEGETDPDPLDGLHVLDGGSPCLHAFTARFQPRLTDAAQAIEYLALFCSYVWGPEGPFTVLHPDSLGSVASGGTIEPPRHRRVTSEGDHEIDASLFYGDGCFRARFLVHPSGMVDMLDEHAETELSFTLPALERLDSGAVRVRRPLSERASEGARS